MANPFLVLGGIAVGVVTAAFGILQVPGWVASAQDASAINDLATLRDTQAAEVSTSGSYSGDIDHLSSGQSGIQFSSPERLISLDASLSGTRWCAVVQSESGTFFAASDSTAPHLGADTAAESLEIAGCDDSVTGAIKIRLDTRAPGCVAPALNLVSPDARIDWGDSGAPRTALDGMNSHEYASAGTFDVRIEGSIPAFAELPASSAACLTDVTAWGATGTTSTAGMFKGAHNIGTVVAPPVTVTNMSNMFQGVQSPKLRLPAWDVTRVTTFSGMFASSSVNPDISTWVTSSALDMSMMFKGTTAFNADLSDWSVSRVTKFDQMFMSARAFDQDISKWQTGSAREMRQMFQDSVATADLSAWSVQKVSWYVSFASGGKLSALPAFRV